MSVAELIAALRQQDPDLPVVVEGCDCSNPVVGVEVVPEHDLAGRRSRAYLLVNCDVHARLD